MLLGGKRVQQEGPFLESTLVSFKGRVSTQWYLGEFFFLAIRETLKGQLHDKSSQTVPVKIKH